MRQKWPKLASLAQKMYTLVLTFLEHILRCSDWVFFVNKKSYGPVIWIKPIVVHYATFVYSQNNLSCLTSIRTIVACYSTWFVTQYSDFG